jgi:hypothetical protein
VGYCGKSGGAAMFKNVKDLDELRAAVFSLLPTSGTLAGIAIGLVGIIKMRPGGGAGTLADEILLLTALGFLVTCYLAFFALHTENEKIRHFYLRAVDIIFLAALSLLVFSGFVVVYEFI